MMSPKHLVVFLALLIPASATAQTVVEAFRSGTPVANLRLRAENVSTDALDDAATALTLRTMLGYRTGAFRGISAFIEAEAVGSVLDDDTYANAGSGALNNGVTDRPVIADPEGTELNQAYLRWDVDGYVWTVGRQEINLSDVRFVGNVGWRQNHQSFDAVRFDAQPTDRIAFSYAFVREVHRLTGQDATTRAHLGEGRLSLGNVGTLAAFAFLMDYPDAAALSRNTIGARFSGTRAINDRLSAGYEASYALQSDAYDNPAGVDANYLAAGVRLNAAKAGVFARYEVLSGSAADGSFVTPLATLHKFNGWADQFLGTPTNGLADLELGFRASLQGAQVLVALHDFSADTGGQHYGRELDAQVTYSFESGVGSGVKLARYMADERGASTTKVWLWLALGL